MSPKQSILVYKKKNHYNEWEFLYSPLSDTPMMGGGNAGTIGQPANGAGTGGLTGTGGGIGGLSTIGGSSTTGGSTTTSPTSPTSPSPQQ
jgi:hypothetical protein